MNGVTCFVFAGASSRDLTTAAHVAAGAALRPCGVCYLDAVNGQRVHISTEQLPVPGAKVTASSCIDPASLHGLISIEESGGGAVNQAVHFAQRCRDSRSAGNPSLKLIDSSPASTALATKCAQAGIQLVSLGLHHELVNVISPFQRDRLIVRSPVKRNTDSSHARLCEFAQVGDKQVVICVSPKDVSMALEMFSLPSYVRYLQPTGSLSADESIELARRCHFMVCNASELCGLVRAAGFNGPPIDENASSAARDVCRLLSEMHRRTVIRCSVAAITLGRNGCAVVDFDKGLAYEVRVALSGGEGVATRSGAGDKWHAEWIFNREVRRLGEPDAAVRATRATAHELGLRPDQFAVAVDPLDVCGPVAGQQQNEPTFSNPMDLSRHLAPLPAGNAM